MPVSSAGPVELRLSWGERQVNTRKTGKEKLHKKVQRRSRHHVKPQRRVCQQMREKTVDINVKVILKKTGSLDRELERRGRGRGRRGMQKETANSFPLTCLTKHKAQEGNTNISHSQRGETNIQTIWDRQWKQENTKERSLKVTSVPN